METTDKGRVKTVRFSSIEADLLESSARERNMSISDVIREGFVLWREVNGDRQGALSAWADRLMRQHGQGAVLTARVNEVFSLDIEIAGRELDGFIAEAVFDRDQRLQIWVGDPKSDARAFLGRLPVAAGAAITVPVALLPSLGASDVNAV